MPSVITTKIMKTTSFIGRYRLFLNSLIILPTLAFCNENKKDSTKVENGIKTEQISSNSLYEKLNLKCDKPDLPNTCNYQDLKIKFDYNNHLNFLFISNKTKEQNFSIEKNFSGIGLGCSLFESKSKKHQLLIVELEYEYSIESNFYLISSNEIKFAGKIITETKSDDFQKLEYKITDDKTFAEIQIKNNSSIKKFKIDYTESSKINPRIPEEEVTYTSNIENSKSEIDLKKLKGEYYLDSNNEEVELILEFEKDFVFLIESGYMGRLYNKHLLKTTFDKEKLKLFYLETKEGSPDVLKPNEKVADIFIENNTLWLDSPYLKSKYAINNKVKVIKSK